MKLGRFIELIRSYKISVLATIALAVFMFSVGVIDMGEGSDYTAFINYIVSGHFNEAFNVGGFHGIFFVNFPFWIISHEHGVWYGAIIATIALPIFIETAFRGVLRKPQIEAIVIILTGGALLHLEAARGNDFIWQLYALFLVIRFSLLEKRLLASIMLGFALMIKPSSIAFLPFMYNKKGKNIVYFMLPLLLFGISLLVQFLIVNHLPTGGGQQLSVQPLASYIKNLLIELYIIFNNVNLKTPDSYDSLHFSNSLIYFSIFFLSINKTFRAKYQMIAALIITLIFNFLIPHFIAPPYLLPFSIITIILSAHLIAEHRIFISLYWLTSLFAYMNVMKLQYDLLQSGAYFFYLHVIIFTIMTFIYFRENAPIIPLSQKT